MTVLADGELRIVNPATLEVVGSVPVTARDQVQAAVAAASGAQSRWAQVSLAERRALLQRVTARVLEHADEIADTVVSETAKPRIEAFTSDLVAALDSLAWLAREAPRLLAPERVRYPQPHLWHKRARLLYEPLGVVGVIAPWNFPFGIPFTQTAFALAAGNAVVLKPSELTPLSGALVERLFAEAGAPEGLVRVVQGSGETGRALVESASLAKLLFTGSTETGRLVAAVAGERLVPVTLELGGKDPMLVLDDADLERAVAGALWASFLNCGQVCSSVEQIVVEAPLYEPFVEELARRAKELRLGDELGPLISEEQRERVAGLVDDARERGARVLAGGRVPERRGWFYEPTVLAGVDGGARIRVEETFGPVVIVDKVGNEADGIAAANGTAFGLSASVWTSDPQRAERVARRLRAGTVWHNDHSYSYATAQASWGGSGESGFGRTHSRHGLYDLTAIKFLDRDSGRLGVPWWFPYEPDGAETFRGVLQALYGPGRLRGAWHERRALVKLARRYRR